LWSEEWSGIESRVDGEGAEIGEERREETLYHEWWHGIAAFRLNKRLLSLETLLDIARFCGTKFVVFLLH
jgi:hypothetical protein